MLKEAIILAGGQGTRLRSVIQDIPKPMAPIQEEPFLTYLLRQSAASGIEHVILSVGYKYEIIRNYYGNRFNDIKLSYAIENERLGTGGGIQNALYHCHTEQVLILNGDSYFDINMEKFMKFHQTGSSHFTIALKPMKNFERYGSVLHSNGVVKAFHEKKFCSQGFINTGIYCLSKTPFMTLGLGTVFSFEEDFLSKYVNIWEFGAYLEDAFFIDIGIPRDYEIAQEKLPKLLNS